MNKLRIAVISDIHAGEGARARDLCPTTFKTRASILDDDYQGKFFQFVSDNCLSADYLVLPGDVTDTAHPEEVQLASEFIVAAAKALGVKETNIVFVPGNHDVDWTVMSSPDATGLRRKQRYDPIRNADYKFKAIAENPNGSLFEEPHFTFWEFPDFVAVGYNSAHHDSPKKFHHGLIDPKHVSALRSALGKLDLSPKRLRLFLVHHHPVQYSDPVSDPPDLSIMVNAEDLERILCEFHFDILVHGHKHIPRFKTHSYNGAPDIAILCAGSFSVQIDVRWAGAINNQFHIINIDGRDDKEEMIQGEVVSWNYICSRGWEPSVKEYGGIPHVEPFGTYTRPPSIASVLRPVISDRLDDSSFVEWNWLVIKVPALRHLRPDVVGQVLDTLAPEFGCRRQGDVPHKMLLLKD